jgi:putative transposase
MLAKTAGTARYAYNWGLAKWNELYEAGEKCSAYSLMKLWQEGRPDWALEVGAACLQRPFMHLEGAFKAFFRGQRKHPTFHKKGLRDGFYVPNTHFKLRGNKVQLPKCGLVRMTERIRYADVKVVSSAVKHQADGWYVVIQVELEEEHRTESDSFVGVDVGCTQLATASDGTTCCSPAKLKDLERQLKRRQRLLARKAKGSNNRAKARLKVARTWQRINNIKQDTAHKFTALIAKNHGTVCIEKLDVKSMQSGDNALVRKGVHNSCMSEILRQLKYKCNNFIEVDKYFPSSKTCSNCGHINAELTLGDRTYNCPGCGLKIDRDLNAALNLRKEGLRIYTVGHTGSACGVAR